jgi:hypothetical protein
MLSQDSATCREFPLVNHVNLVRKKHEFLVETAGKIGDGGNSGFQGLNLAIQFGANPIAIVGFDMRIDKGVHWHGRHLGNLNNPNLAHVIKWRKNLDGAARGLEDLGVQIFNVSSISALTSFKVMSCDEASKCFESLRRPKRSRSRSKKQSSTVAPPSEEAMMFSSNAP